MLLWRAGSTPARRCCGTTRPLVDSGAGEGDGDSGGGGEGPGEGDWCRCDQGCVATAPETPVRRWLSLEVGWH